MKQRLLALLFIAQLLPLGMWAALAVDDTFIVNGMTFKVTSVSPREVMVGNGEDVAIDKEAQGELIIPESVTDSDGNSYSVTSIGRGAFKYCLGISAINIPNTVISIASSAFFQTGMTSLTLPASVTKIGLQAFEANMNIVEIKVEVENARYDSRDNCNAIIESETNKLIVGCKNTTIPNSVQNIGEGAFYGLWGLKSIAIPNSVKSIGDRAFQNCELTEIHSYIEEPFNISSTGFDAVFDSQDWSILYVPAGTKVKYEATDGWKEFKNIVEMGSEGGALKVNDAFTVNGVSYYVKSVQPMEVAVGVYHTSDNIITAVPQDTTGTIVIPSTVTAPDGNLYTVTSVGYQAFRGCANINSVSLPESITEISPQSFTMCVKLSAINIPNSVNSIGYNAFMNCNELHSVTLPNSITSIGFGAFGWCLNLLEVYSYIEEPFAISSGGMGNAYNTFDYNREGLTLYVPAGTKALYEATDGWKEFKNIVEMVNIDPIEGETTVNTESLNGQDLSDNVVDDVYYNTGDGSYDATDGSIVIGETTNMGQITNAVPGSDDVKNNFTGIILKVAAGKGIIKVNVKTSGNAQLVVQVGNGTPMIASKTEQGDVVISYDVEEDTYVYIYAIIGSSASPSMRASSTDEVRIYGFTVSPGASGVKAVWANEDSKAQIFSLDGKPLNEPQKGVNIVRMSNGQVRKVVVK